MSGPGIEPPQAPRRLLLALLPDDDWSREYVAELDAEHGLRAAREGRGRARLWYVGQVLSPETARFAWLVRRRRARGGRRSASAGGPEGAGPLDGWIQDLRHTGRGLARDARLAVFVVVTLALGIGGTGAMFGVVDRLFLGGPAHVSRPHELVRLYLRIDGADGTPPRTTPHIPYLTAEAIRRDATRFDGVALHETREVLARVAGGPARTLRTSTVGEGYFPLLGVEPALGRFFDGTGPGDADVAVVSWELWTSSLGGDPDALGRTVRLPEREAVIVGVAPPGFTGPGLEAVDLWLPLRPAEAGARNWRVVGRLRGAVEDTARAGLAAAEANRVHEATDPGRFFQWARAGTVVAAPLSSDDTGAEPAEAVISRLLAAVAVVVLLIAAANVVNLLLARLTRRRREVAVRLALGAGRWRLTRLLLSESLALAALGGLVALPVAYGGAQMVRRVLLPHVAWPASPLQGRVLVVTLLLTLGTGLLVGLLPARRAGRTDVSEGLRASARSGSGRRARLHLGLAALQVSLSAALLVGAGLFMKSFWTLRVTDLGVDADAVTAFTLHSLDPSAIPQPSEREYRLYVRALEALAGEPEVERAAASLGLPFLYNFGRSIVVPGADSVPALPGGGPYLTAVTEGYFEAVGTEVLRGRAFTAREVAGDEAVMVVGESMARLLWPGGDALGACVRVGDAESPCSRVVGVAEDVHRVGYREPPSFQYYVPLAPSGTFGGMTLVVRLRSRSPRAVDDLGARLRELDPAVDWVDAVALDSALDPQVRPWRLGTWVLGTASGLALLVALVGVYGVLAYLVEQRRREIGIRIALGASGAGIRALVLRTGLGATVLGLSGGVALVLASTPWLRPLLFETEVADPLVLVGVAALLLGAGTLACLLPAGRAARVQPATCLEAE